MSQFDTSRQLISTISSDSDKDYNTHNVPKLPRHKINPSYTVRVLCCVLFIFLTEICLAHYVYRLINSEIRSEYISKSDLRLYLTDELRSENTKKEILSYLKEILPQVSNTSTRKKRDLNHYNLLETQNSEPHVEFFDPALRGSLEAKDQMKKQQTGKGAAPGGDSWVWLTSYSRIPEKALEGYCKNIQTYCPPGKPGPLGPPGIPGHKGEKGEKGLPGIPGPMGVRGMPGLPGLKGLQGRSGLDGRDGIPGEPGLDGIPGRNGHDGAAGIDGSPGFPGKDGKNGVDGRPGSTGPQGPQGSQGPRGLTGPRGRSGKPGTNGIPGTPGITAYKTVINDTTHLLIPPTIANLKFNHVGPIVVHEGENVRLHCSATGNPTPHITWFRMDNKPINRGAWQDIGVAGPVLNITRINRIHIGKYMCIADNGVPPQSNQTFSLEVYFPPLIRIKNLIVPVRIEATAYLECETEAFPEPVRYWERSDGQLLEDSYKYRVSYILEREEYKSRMLLNITNSTAEDIGYFYLCVSKNELQTTRGEITLFEAGPHHPGQHTHDLGKETIYGVLPPDKVSLEDLCGPQLECTACEKVELKCKGSGVSLIDLVSRWEIRPFGTTKYPGYPLRKTECVLYAVGKPVYHRFTDTAYGSWMKDPVSDDLDLEKIWVTNETDDMHLFQYNSKSNFRKNKVDRAIQLTRPFSGNSQVIYDGHFYYNEKDTTRVIKFNLVDESMGAYDLPVVIPNNKTYSHLYVSQYNLMDFSVDDNGLWVIFAVPESNNTAVVKLDERTMEAQYIWNVSISHRKVGEMFVVCGVLYAVDSTSDRNTKIRFALDLYKGVLLDVNLGFTNPFRKTTMITYNNRSKELVTWDKGNQLTYPVRYHEIGYNLTSDKPETLESINSEMQTGYEILDP